MKPFIYLRGLRHVDLSVFCVEGEQKTYWDPVFNVRVPYSSGQQVKRSILDGINNELRLNPSAVTFVFDVKKGALGEGEVLSLCDPQYYDQLFGGWMKAEKTKDSKKDEKKRTLKRRSPFSISAMRLLHPLLGGQFSENITFDRSDKPDVHKVVVRGQDGKPLSEKEIEDLLKGTDRSLYRKWIPNKTRATGLFVFDVAIDLRTLFAVSVNQMEPELSKEMIAELKENGWISAKNVFGDCLVMPKNLRDKAIPAIAKSLINWRISSNQSRTFSLMETLAVAISDNANTLAGAIRAKLMDDQERKVKPIVDETAGAELFVSLPCSAYMLTETESADALQKAEERLIELLSSYDYEKQM